MNYLDKLWPGTNRIKECLSTDAENIPEHILLAVHQSIDLYWKKLGDTEGENKTEDMLFKEFFEDTGSGIRLQIITGQPGVGKSHIIKWMHAKINTFEREKREKYLVIRIPKSVSLRNVVELILEPLSNNQTYEQIRTDFQKAADNIDQKNSGTLLWTGLKFALESEANNLTLQLQNAANNNPNQNIEDLLPNESKELAHAKNLANYFNEPTIQDKYLLEIFPDIIKRAFEGNALEKSIDEDGNEITKDIKIEFSKEQLKIEDNDIGDFNRQVKYYFTHTLNNDEGYNTALNVLNRVLDDAINQAFNLNNNLGGKSLVEIVDDIRKSLLEDNKELVLLVEDFQTLTGIQEQLLNICIKDAIQDGTKIMAPMRTAIAVTEDYFNKYSTYLSRAGGQWFVQSDFSNKNNDENNKLVLKNTVDLVASYCNAMRHTNEELKKMYQESESLTNWANVYSVDDEENLLHLFSKTPDQNDISLFPFNTSIIKCLIEDNMMTDGRYEFNPRQIITQIIEPVLKLKGEYENNNFPPAYFRKTKKLIPEIENDVDNINCDPGQKERLKTFIFYWFNNPKNQNELKIDEKYFKIFNLPIIKFNKTDPLKPDPLKPDPLKPDPLKPDPPKPPPKPEIPQVILDKVKGWDDAITNWSRGNSGKFTNENARDLRNILFEFIKNDFNWDILFSQHQLKKDIKYAHFIELGNAAGEGQLKEKKEDKKISLLEITETKRALYYKAIIRFYFFKGKENNYKGREEDIVSISNLLSILTPKTQNLIKKDQKEEISEIISVLVKQAKLFGIKIDHKYQNILLSLKDIDCENLDLVNDPIIDKYIELKNGTLQYRKIIQNKLKHLLCAYQGTGDKALSIDISKLPINLEEKLPDSLSDDIDGIYITNLRDFERREIPNLKKFFIQLDNKLKEHFLEIDSLDYVDEKIYELIKKFGESGLSSNSFLIPNKFFKNLNPTDFKLFKSSIFKIPQIENSEEILIQMGKIDIKFTSQFSKILESYEDFVKNIEEILKNVSSNQEIVNLEQTQNNLLKSLVDLQIEIKEIKEKCV
tara:strand:- start:592 stop:3735 length:3144 start_codon:yes stop_codon:yes gene_type:complete